MNNTELKPCPFCGSTNLVVDSSDMYRWYVECWDCEADGPFADDEGLAIEAWNKREGKALLGHKVRIDPTLPEGWWRLDG